MSPADFAIACEAIRAAKGKPVTLHVRRQAGRMDRVEVTHMLPTGAWAHRAVCAGTFDKSITIGELKADLIAAEQELGRQQTRAGKAA